MTVTVGGALTLLDDVMWRFVEYIDMRLEAWHMYDSNGSLPLLVPPPRRLSPSMIMMMMTWDMK